MVMKNKLLNDTLFEIVSEYVDNHHNEFGGGIVHDSELQDLLFDFWIGLLQKPIRDIILTNEFSNIEEIKENPSEYLRDIQPEFLAYKTSYIDEKTPDYVYMLSMQYRKKKSFIESEEVIPIVANLRTDKTLSENIEHILKSETDKIDSEMTYLKEKKENLNKTYELWKASNIN